jgi:hypothetical protein
LKQHPSFLTQFYFTLSTTQSLPRRVDRRRVSCCGHRSDRRQTRRTAASETTSAVAPKRSSRAGDASASSALSVDGGDGGDVYEADTLPLEPEEGHDVGKLDRQPAASQSLAVSAS